MTKIFELQNHIFFMTALPMWQSIFKRYIKRTGAAILSFVTHGGKSTAGGGSTITQQLVKNITNEKDDSGTAGAIRKIKEMIRANQVENIISKDQILELYMNIIFLGGNVYGVEQASLTYFNKHAKDLNLSEAAIIAGLFQAPNTYNPVRNPEKAAYRRNIVLTLMVRHGYITQEEADCELRDLAEHYDNVAVLVPLPEHLSFNVLNPVERSESGVSA